MRGGGVCGGVRGDGSECARVRQVQMELQQLGERMAHLQHLHGVNLHSMQRMHAEAQSSRAHIAELTRRLEMADAQVSCTQCQPSARARARAWPLATGVSA